MKPAAASARAEWICYVASGLPGIFLALLTAAGIVPERIALIFFSLSFVGLNLAHMAATWSRVYLDPAGVRGAFFERIAVPAVLCVGAILGEALGFGIALFGLQYYLSLHHAMMQNYGLLRAVQRRSGRRFSPQASRLDQAACLLLPLGALAYRAREVCRTYSTAPLATPPLFLVVALLAVGAVALLVFLGREILAWRSGETVNVLGPAIVVSGVLQWTALLIAIDHPAIPLYALASGHYVQYLYFVWKFEKSRPGLGVVPGWLRARIAPPSRLAYLTALVGFGGFVVLLLTFGSAFARLAAEASGLRPAGVLPIPPWAAAMIGVNLSHYWLDHRIWRMPRQNALQPA